MVPVNERRGMIALAVLLGLLVLIVICTGRCGSDPQSENVTAVTDTVTTSGTDTVRVETDTVSYDKKHHRSGKNKKYAPKSSYKERDPLAEDEKVTK